MSVQVESAGFAGAAAASVLPTLAADKVASRLFAHDDTLWGEEARSEASIRLGWVDAVQVSRPLVGRILALRDEFRGVGLDRVVLCGMGGSSLAPEVIAASAGVPLVVLDGTAPGQVARATGTGLDRTVVVVSSKSGSTLETDSQRRAFEAAFEAAGIDPAERIVVVTDPGSALETYAEEHDYRVFLADPHVGGRYSALTAFGLVPSGLAGADIEALLNEAEIGVQQCLEDSEENPSLRLAAALAGGAPARDKIGIFSDSDRIVGFPAWAEQLIAESTGKQGTGLLPIALTGASPEVVDPSRVPEDVTLVRVTDDPRPVSGELVGISGSLGEQLVVWEAAVAVAGRILGINPFDQPDVESAKAAARDLLDHRPEAEPARFSEDGIQVRATFPLTATTLDAAVAELASRVDGHHGYLAIQAYVDREAASALTALRPAAVDGLARPVTFGWGPRFLHSTGQYHKGGPRTGVFLQITAAPRADADVAIPDRPFSFGELIVAQAQGDCAVLAAHGLPVLTLEVSGSLLEAGERIAAAFRRLEPGA
ncbi:MAG: glucose-6-phosphate isomerase [Microbacteriaceae bacterium]|jgi:glucose-6-phosphate isomerase|nr:glucose-6-phosphate isomerase [Microbacteriaceae bacterium]MCI1207765.1 glucose-6-phosphate isomerase [Microbacteriaceae bacterium]